ncbi:hypothetical protein JMUB6875_48550 [Nocardia sp. JMUB6875]|uniref:DUF6188 family protein n=1 Tax=Nocardia sp. JMUB6875 TaxID=3158170 RepID=UPI0032E5D748
MYGLPEGVDLSFLQEVVLGQVPIEAAPALVAFIGHAVVNVEYETNGTLELTFSNGQLIRILDSSEHYESYQIHNSGSTIVV